MQHNTTSPTLFSILNKPIKAEEKEYLPTPITPGSDFPQFHKKDATFNTFSVLKTPARTASNNNNNDNNNNNNIVSEVKTYDCPQCPQTFSRPHNLKSHLTTHSSEKPFQCDVCHLHFRRQHDLKRHQKLHTGERPYVCKDCYRSFARLDALNRHRRAEGGTACSTVHQQVKLVKQEKDNNDTSHINNSNATTLSSPLQQQQQQQRPAIPQLHIPHPASHLYSKQLPSPSALSISNFYSNNNPSKNLLLPNTPSSPPTPSLLANSSKSPPPLYHPYSNDHSWSPYRHHKPPTLPPLSATTNLLEKLQQENKDLKKDIDQLRAMANKKATELQSRVHDLEVENKVLRSLIQTKSDNQVMMDCTKSSTSHCSSISTSSSSSNSY